MDRKHIALVVVAVAAVLTAGIVFDFDTLSPRHLTGRNLKEVFAIAAVAIIVLMALAGKFSGRGPQPPRHP